MKRAWAIGTVQGAPERLPIEGHEVLAQVDEGLPPGAQGLLEARRVAHGPDVPKRVMGRSPMGHVETRRAPRRLGVSPGCACAPMLRPTNRREHGDDEDVDEIQCG